MGFGPFWWEKVLILQIHLAGDLFSMVYFGCWTFQATCCDATGNPRQSDQVLGDGLYCRKGQLFFPTPNPKGSKYPGIHRPLFAPETPPGGAKRAFGQEDVLQFWRQLGSKADPPSIVNPASCSASARTSARKPKTGRLGAKGVCYASCLLQASRQKEV